MARQCCTSHKHLLCWEYTSASVVVDDFEMGIKHWLVLQLLPVCLFTHAPTTSKSCGHCSSVTPVALCNVVWHRSTRMHSNRDWFGNFESCDISSPFIYCCSSLYFYGTFVRVGVLIGVCWGFKSCTMWHVSLNEWSLTFWRIVMPLNCWCSPSNTASHLKRGESPR